MTASEDWPDDNTDTASAQVDSRCRLNAMIGSTWTPVLYGLAGCSGGLLLLPLVVRLLPRP